MPLEFIREHNYVLGSFEYLLQQLQNNYGTIMALLQAFYAAFSLRIQDLPNYLDISDPHTISHSVARCYSTRCVLSQIFGILSWYRTPGLVSDDMLLTSISLGGEDFPDHTFVTIKYKDDVYILQSYYFSYLLSGKYGVIKVSGNELQELADIITEYQYLENNYDIQRIYDNNVRLSKFTGVDSSRHHGNVVQKFGDNTIEIINGYANSQCVMRCIQRNMYMFEDVLFSMIGNLDDVISLRIFYYFSDAFKPEAHPLLVPVNGVMSMLPDHHVREVFKSLVGTEYTPANLFGVHVGPAANDKILSSKVIDVTVRQIEDIIRSIRGATEPILYANRIKNFRTSRLLPIIGPIITLDQDEQATKEAAVQNLIARGQLPLAIPPYPVFPMRHGLFI